MEINWNTTPVTAEASIFSKSLSQKALDYLRTMHDGDGNSLHGTDSDADKLLNVQTPIILSLLRDLQQDQFTQLSESDFPITVLGGIEISWTYVGQAIKSLEDTGTLIVRNRQENFVEIRLSDVIRREAPQSIEIDLDHSSPFDVHTWSDHPEANAFVDRIQADYFTDVEGQKTAKRKHIKILLLDLYVKWTLDPNQWIAISRNESDYQAGSRYNELNISRKIISILDVLRRPSVDLIYFNIGFNDRLTGNSRLSRIRPTQSLIEMFQEARFGIVDFEIHPDRECIVLRDDNKNEINYEETDSTNAMREHLRAYNNLIASTFIDIPTLPDSWIETDSENSNQGDRLYITQQNKFTRRIFNRSSFEKGGRYYGGWWQNCPKEWRGQIFIDDCPVSEIDYSGLHIVLLYAMEGTNYWEDIGRDPYTITNRHLGLEGADHRAICKSLALVALNAPDENTAFGAFRAKAPNGSPAKNLNNHELKEILDGLREIHGAIAHRFASDAGIDLMNIDAKITEQVINHFTEQQIPILSIHDSYLVPYGLERNLESAMITAFDEITDVRGVKLTHETIDPLQFPWLHPQNRFNNDYEGWKEAISDRLNPPKTERYQYLWDKFKEHHSKPDRAGWHYAR